MNQLVLESPLLILLATFIPNDSHCIQFLDSLGIVPMTLVLFASSSTMCASGMTSWLKLLYTGRL